MKFTYKNTAVNHSEVTGRIFVFYFSLFVAATFTSCESQNESGSLFQLLHANETNVEFINRVNDSETLNIFNYRNFYNGGGVAIGDINNDSLADIFLVSNMSDSKLYLNKGNFKFEDVTAKSGIHTPAGRWRTGVTLADVNADSWLDIYISNASPEGGVIRANELYINRGDGTFIEQAVDFGLDDEGFSTHAAFFDYDRDGDLDAYILNNSFYPIGKLGYRNIRTQRDSAAGNKLLRNDDNKFTDASEQAGIYGSLIGFGLGVAVGDLNADNWPDLYISNDFYERDYFYINNRNGTFSEVIKDAMPHISASSMGADIADINNDNMLDVFVTDMLPGDDIHLKQMMTYESVDLYALKLQRDFHHQLQQNTLQINNGDGTFSDVSRFAGVEATDWSWGSLIFDMDNDGLKDIFVANGIAKDLADQDFLRFLGDENRMAQAAAGRGFNLQEFLSNMPSRPIENYAFKNMGQLSFKNVTAEWRLEGPGFSNGAAYGDLDNDGDLDLVVNNVNHKASIYKNKTMERGKNHYVKVVLRGNQKNKYGIGATVTLYQHDKVQVLQQMPNRGFQSSVDPILLFGLGENTIIDSITVLWPDDRVQLFRKVKCDATLLVEQAKADDVWKPSSKKVSTPFIEVSSNEAFEYVHKENLYIDFYKQPLLKQMYSTQGPALVTGDVDGDGLTDIIVGSARGQSLQLFIQLHEGSFQIKNQTSFLQDSLSEIVAATLVDVDVDNDLDLFAVTGGSEFERNDMALKDKLFMNDGKGNFSLQEDFPNVFSNGSCVAAADFDKDGDVDFFVGSRAITDSYGQDPPSHLYINDGKGRFKNYTKRFFTSQELGMITDALWADIDNDTYPELIVVGDWMPITIFKNQNGKALVHDTTELQKSSGWWNCIETSDVDNDGDADFIVGNLGSNSRMRADSLHAAEMYINDFDNNGTVEQIITRRSQNGENYPMILKHDLEKQLPIIKKRFLNHSDFAGKKITQLFSKDELATATIKKVFTNQSCLLLNDGKGNLKMKPLPYAAQLSPIHAIETLDYNDDGYVDVLLGGNFFDVPPEIGRYDASYGLVLCGNGIGEFEILKPKESGFFLTGQVRELALIDNVKSMIIVAIKNNDRAQVFKVR